MKTANELLESLIESQKQIVEIWKDSNNKYGQGNYQQATSTLKFLEGYKNIIIT